MKREHGFTLIEVLVALALLVPLVGLLLGVSDRANRNLMGDDLAAKTTENLQRSIMRISQLVRSCSFSTYVTQATAADVAAGRATAIGEWIEPTEGQAATGVRFQCGTGNLAMDPAALTEPRSIFWRRDPGETANGIDDDEDGLVDEGQIVLSYEGFESVMANHIESCIFTLDDRLLHLELRSGARQAGGNVQRFGIRGVISVRNN